MYLFHCCWKLSCFGFFFALLTNNSTVKVLITFGAHTYVFLFGIYLGVERLGQMVCIFLALVDTASFLKNVFKPP